MPYVSEMTDGYGFSPRSVTARYTRRMTNSTPAPAPAVLICRVCETRPAEYRTEATDASPATFRCAECVGPTTGAYAVLDTGVDHRFPAPQTIADEVEAFVRRFVVFQDPAHYRLLSLYILHTHAFEAAQATPYLYVKSAEPQSGKTRTLETAELLVKNAYRAANMSQGALYAAIEAKQPTVLIDEVDAIFSGAKNEDLRGMLNAGYKVGGTVSRQVMLKGGVRDVEDYDVFSPKMLAGIDNGEIPATIADRCLVFDLKRKKRDEEVERLNYRIVRPQAEALKARVHHWVMERIEKIAAVSVTDIPEISDRAFEIAEPLLQIAALIPGMTAQAREDIIHIFSQRKPAETIQTKALRVAKALFEEGDRDRISSAEFAAAMEMSAPKASRILTPYGITTTTIVFPGGNRSKGYHRASFADAWERYL